MNEPYQQVRSDHEDDDGNDLSNDSSGLVLLEPS
jgi:hypothetical protein